MKKLFALSLSIAAAVQPAAAAVRVSAVAPTGPMIGAQAAAGLAPLAGANASLTPSLSLSLPAATLNVPSIRPSFSAAPSVSAAQAVGTVSAAQARAAAAPSAAGRAVAAVSQTPAASAAQAQAARQQTFKAQAEKVGRSQEAVGEAAAPLKKAGVSAEASHLAGRNAFDALKSAAAVSAEPSARARAMAGLKAADQAPETGEPDFVVPQTREALLTAWTELKAQRAGLQIRRDRVSYAVTAHSYHGIQDGRNAVSHNRKAAESREKLAEITKALAEVDRRLTLVNAAIDALPAPEAGSSEAERLQDLAEKGGPGFSWRLPRSIRQAEPAPEPLVQGLRQGAWKRLYGYGFKLTQEKEGKGKKAKTVITVEGRWTETPINTEAFGIALSIVDGALEAKKDGRTLSDKELRQWLEIAEAAGAEEPLVFDVTDAEAVAAGAQLFSWGVPAHILNHSLEAVMKPGGDGKEQISLSPDVIFYRFVEGRAVATPTGELLAQFLQQMKDPAKLTKIELHALALILNLQAVPWAAYDEAATQGMLSELMKMFESGRLTAPLIQEPLGIDLAKPAFDLSAYLRTQRTALLEKLRAALRDGKPVDELVDLTQAVRFAWTALSPAREEDMGYRAVLHRDGLSFLKHTGFAEAQRIWSMLPLGEAVQYLGLDDLIKEIVEKGVKGRPLVVADAGLVDLTHPDMAKNVVDIDREGGRVEVEALFTALSDEDSDFEDEDEDEESDTGAADGGVPKADDNSVHSHGTAVATPMALIAEALGTQVVSIDLPGFSGDADLVPPGVQEADYFYRKFASALQAAIEAYGARFINFSWGGGYDHRIHQFIDRMNEEHGAIFTNAAGNSGIGFNQQQTPSFADSIVSVAGEDGLGGKVSFTSGGGFAQTSSGKLRFMPDVAAPAGYFAANSRVEKTDENPDSSTIYLDGAGDYIHMRGTSFSDPLYVTVLTALAALAEHDARVALSSRLSGAALENRLEELAPAIAKAAVASLVETAEMLPGVPAFYQGAGRIRPKAARALVSEKVRALIGA